MNVWSKQNCCSDCNKRFSSVFCAIQCVSFFKHSNLTVVLIVERLSSPAPKQSRFIFCVWLLLVWVWWTCLWVKWLWHRFTYHYYRYWCGLFLFHAFPLFMIVLRTSRYFNSDRTSLEQQVDPFSLRQLNEYIFILDICMLWVYIDEIFYKRYCIIIMYIENASFNDLNKYL